MWDSPGSSQFLGGLSQYIEGAYGKEKNYVVLTAVCYIAGK